MCDHAHLPAKKSSLFRESTCRKNIGNSLWSRLKCYLTGERNLPKVAQVVPKHQRCQWECAQALLEAHIYIDKTIQHTGKHKFGHCHAQHLRAAVRKGHQPYPPLLLKAQTTERGFIADVGLPFGIAERQLPPAEYRSR